jgi:hypothetical protein
VPTPTSSPSTSRRFRPLMLSSSDVIEAADAAEAEELAIAAWRVVRPGRTYRPLLTVERRAVEPTESATASVQSRTAGTP